MRKFRKLRFKSHFLFGNFVQQKDGANEYCLACVSCVGLLCVNSLCLNCETNPPFSPIFGLILADCLDGGKVLE